MTKSILFICYYYPPIKSIGVLRNYYLSNELKSYFSEIHVITTTNLNLMARENLPLYVDSIVTSLTIDYRTVSNLGIGNKSHFSEEKKKGIVRKLLNVNNSFPFNLFFGEGGLVYMLSSFFKAIKYINSRNITHIYTSFMPAADHVVAYSLTLIFPRKIKWIADFRDLHIDPIYNHVIWKGLQHWFWKKMLKRAHIVTTVSKGLAKHLRYYHSDVFVMRNGIGKLPLQIKETGALKKFSIVYTGSMVKTERDPTLLLLALRELLHYGTFSYKEIQVIYAGKDSKLWQSLISQFQLDSIFSDRGLVSLNESRRLQHSAHINLLLTSAHPELTGVLTGKLYEYIEARRPVLCIVNGTHDSELEEIFATTRAGLVTYNYLEELEKIKCFIEKKYQEWASKGDVNCEMSSESLAPFKWENIAQSLIKKLNIETIPSVQSYSQ